MCHANANLDCEFVENTRFKPILNCKKDKIEIVPRAVKYQIMTATTLTLVIIMKEMRRVWPPAKLPSSPVSFPSFKEEAAGLESM